MARKCGKASVHPPPAPLSSDLAWQAGELGALEESLRNILNLIIIGSSLILVIALLSNWQRASWILGFLVITTSICRLLGRSGHWRQTTAVALLCAALYLCFEAAEGNGIHDLGIIIIPATLVITSFLLEGTAYLAFSSIIILAVSFVAAWSWFHYGSDKFSSSPLSEYVVLMITLIITAITGRLAARHLFRSWRQSRELADRYRGIFQSIQDVYYEMLPDGTVLELSPTGESLFCIGRDAIIGSSLLPFYENITVHETFIMQLRRHGHLSNYEVVMKDRKGCTHNVLISASLKRESGASNEKVIGSIRDITDRRQLEEHLVQAQKMESIGTLAGGIAHDFNNLLTVINGNCELARIRIEAGKDPQEDLRKIHKAGLKATELTRKLLTFSRKQAYHLVAVDAVSVLAHLEEDFKTLIGEDIRIDKKIAPDLPPIMADPSQLEQVLINLLVNARDAINEKTIRASDKSILISAKACQRCKPDSQDRSPQLYLELAVTDKGIGINPEVKSRIFDPFFTTKKCGTGLGLATVYGIVRQNNGFIEIESRPQQGTSISVYWPATQHHATERPRQKEQMLPGSEEILLVEDDPAVRDFVQRALAACGYAVTEAPNGKAALQLIMQQPNSFHLLISDVVMPEMGGEELFAAVCQLVPRLKVLFMSGYTEEHLSPGGVTEDGIHFIQKPFTPADLSKKVRTLLDFR